MVNPSAHTAAATNGITIGQYLIQRLRDYGVAHVFGIPGDYVLNFYTMLEQSPIDVIGTTREDCAGFAADAYARVHGMGVVCVTYCVGGLSVCNSIAGAYAEKSPVVVISGAPGMNERINNPLLHHKVRDFRTQLEVFDRLCVAATDLSDPTVAFREIDRVLATVARFKRPGYIELPRDMVDVVPTVVHSYQQPPVETDAHALHEAVEEAAAWIARSHQPVILAGVEIHRFGLHDSLLALAEGWQIPIAATLLGKSVIRENHPLYLGLYEGAMGHAEVTQFVESSDCTLLLGTFMTDINLGIYTAKLDPARCIYATSEQLRMRHHHYHDVLLGDFIGQLAARPPASVPRTMPSVLQTSQPKPYQLRANEPIRIQSLFARLNEQLDDRTIVIADIGDSLFGATELEVHGRSEFLSPAYYTSMGFSVPAALGAQAARPHDRVVVVCGDGAFQMTGMELSTIVRRGYAPLVVVLDNGGYGTERILHHGTWKFNDIHGWNYSRLPEILGGGKGHEVRTEADWDRVLRACWDDPTELNIVHVHLQIDDHSPALNRLAERLGARI